VQHFKVFGCIGHVHLPNASRKKLDNKSIKCVFMGINEALTLEAYIKLRKRLGICSFEEIN